ncbi:hypothetical protein PGB90_000236 [Kerria lacca]
MKEIRNKKKNRREIFYEMKIFYQGCHPFEEKWDPHRITASQFRFKLIIKGGPNEPPASK